MSLINAIWWSTSNRDSTYGAVVQFGTVQVETRFWKKNLQVFCFVFGGVVVVSSLF
jgi:hypothetical protein